jgi:hypothetical protein
MMLEGNVTHCKFPQRMSTAGSYRLACLRALPHNAWARGLELDAVSPHVTRGTPQRAASLFHGLDDGFHVREVLVERTAAPRRESVDRPRHAPRERFLAGHVVGLFQLPGVYAEVSVCRL